MLCYAKEGEFPMHIYRTAQVAKATGIHPNTVRLYETLGLIPAAPRQANGYRVFTDYHIEQIRLARMALKVETLQNGLRKQAIGIVKAAAARDLDTAFALTQRYIHNIQSERVNALEAITQVEAILKDVRPASALPFKRKEAAEHLHISMDTLRNWELNGLLAVSRKENGYRIYTAEDIRRLNIIRSLRCANYSLEAILRMLNSLSGNADADIGDALDTPDAQADIVSVCDKLLTSLTEAERNAKSMLGQIKKLSQII